MPDEISKEAPPAEPPAAGPNRSARRENAACDALRTFLRDLHGYRFGSVPPRAEEAELVLRLKVRPREDWHLSFAPGLGEQMAAQLDNWQAGRNVYREGSVYCFRCDTSECAHARPASPLEVFKEYAPNGTPQWHELAQALLAAGDERVDRLYQDHGGVIARYQAGRQLRGRQLSSFGRSSKTYAILGQVVAGFFPFEPSAGTPGAKPGRLAVTFQVVEGRGPRGELMVRLNAITGADPAQLREQLASGGHPVLERAWKTAAEAIARIEQVARNAAASETMIEALRRVPGVLRRLAESLERGGRQESRRTFHVEQRRREQRPVHKALDDLHEVDAGRVFEDEKAATTVVCGPQCRAHVFNRDGRHVTSFSIRPQAIDFRLRTRRWRMLSPAEVREFKQRVETYAPHQKDKGPPLI